MKCFTYELSKPVCFPHFFCTTSLSRLLQLEIQLKNESTRLVDENGSDVSGITYTADHLSNALVAYNMSKGTQYYWTLPKKLLGNKVNV